MTRDRDIERVLDGWFAEGPTIMPDRFFDDVVQRVNQTSQRRLAGLTTRFLAVNTNFRLAAAAALVAVGVAAAIYFVGAHPSQTPEASLTPAPSPTSSLEPLPAGLTTGRWNGPTREITGMTPAAQTAAITLNRTLMRFDAGGGAARPDLRSTAAVSGSSTLRFELATAALGCAAGDVGTYHYTLSSGQGYLTLTPESEACAPRAQALSGVWERSRCLNSGAWCLGDAIEAGRHASAVFNPFLTFDAWTFQYGRLAYTVPDGWGNPEEDRAEYVIARTDLGEDASIWLLSDEGAHAQPASCPENTADLTVGRTSSALASWLQTRPGLTATKPQAVTVGGLSGVSLDVSVTPGWTRTCPGDSRPAIELFADTDGNEHDVRVLGDTPMRIFLLDLGDGRSLIVFINAKDKATYDILLPEAMSIIGSFQFTR